MSEREITLPEPLKIGPEPKEGEEDTRERYGVPELLMFTVNSEPFFNNHGVGIRAAARVEKAVQAWHEADPKPETLRVESEALGFVVKALEKPTPKNKDGDCYPFKIGRAILPLLDAITTAREL